MRRQVWLTLRLHRFEVFAFGVGLVVLSVGAFAIATYIDGLKPAAACFSPTGEVAPSCQRAFDAYNSAQQSLGSLLAAPTLIVTYAIGLFLGVPIVGREIERGTTRLAWSLGPSRWRWFLTRVLPITLVVLVSTFLAGIAMDRVFASVNTNQDLTQSFSGYGARGGLLASRALFIFGVAVVAGAILGRALPAVIVAALVALIALGAGENFYQGVILRGEAVPVLMTEGFYGSGDQGLYFDTLWQLPDGTLVGYQYFGDNGPPYDPETGIPTYPQYQLIVPGSQYRWVEGREAVALGGATIVALLLAGAIVQRRRPG